MDTVAKLTMGQLPTGFTLLVWFWGPITEGNPYTGRSSEVDRTFEHLLDDEDGEISPA